MIPVLETERLILRGRRQEDFPAYAAMWAAPESVRFISGTPVSREDAWHKFARMEGFWSICGYGWWIVEEKATGAVIGEVGLADFKRDIKPSLECMPEFGWIIAPAAHGKGYAKEAVGAALRWADDKFPHATFCCIIDAANAASISVAAALGFRPTEIGVYKASDVQIYRRPAAGKKGAGKP